LLYLGNREATPARTDLLAAASDLLQITVALETGRAVLVGELVVVAEFLFAALVLLHLDDGVADAAAQVKGAADQVLMRHARPGLRGCSRGRSGGLRSSAGRGQSGISPGRSRLLAGTPAGTLAG